MMVLELTKPMAKSWRRMKMTASPRTQSGAKAGPLSGRKLISMLEVDLLPNT